MQVEQEQIQIFLVLNSTIASLNVIFTTQHHSCPLNIFAVLLISSSMLLYSMVKFLNLYLQVLYVIWDF